MEISAADWSPMMRRYVVYALTISITVSHSSVVGSIAQADQQSAPTEAQVRFEVATVKPSNENMRWNRQGIYPNGRYLAINMPLIVTIASAYGVRTDQIREGPSWISSERFDIEAKAEQATAMRFSRENMQLMLRSLLADRFKLLVRQEETGVRAFELVVARPDRRLGTHMSVAKADCSGRQRDTTGRLSPSGSSSTPSCGIVMNQGSLTGLNATAAGLAASLAVPLGSTVIDRTGLVGAFDFNLQWGDAPLGSLENRSGESNTQGPSIFTAIEQQLGLRLRPSHSQADTIIVEHVEAPTPD
jgi:uncharacterized protein (TIGR03435 family)